jgi:RES domain-containing protein
MPSKLQDLVKAVVLTRLPRTRYYRSVDLRLMVDLGVKLLDGTYTGCTGGRYNKPGSDPTCYLAGSETLAAWECEHEAMALGLRTVKRNPRVTCGVEIKGVQVLDLTNNKVLVSLGVTRADLTKTTTHWRDINKKKRLSLTQRIGEAARCRPDCDGILCPTWLVTIAGPTMIPRLENLVLFMDPVDGTKHRNSKVSITVIDPTGLLV